VGLRGLEQIGVLTWRAVAVRAVVAVVGEGSVRMRVVVVDDRSPALAAHERELAAGRSVNVMSGLNDDVSGLDRRWTTEVGASQRGSVDYDEQGYDGHEHRDQPVVVPLLRHLFQSSLC
jgi:hypothetical protein